MLEEAAIEEEEAFAAAFWLQMIGMALSISAKKQKGVSLPGKSPNIDRDYARTHTYYMLKYFWPQNMRRPGTLQFGPQQPESAFERRFRMPRLVFNRVLVEKTAASEYLRKGLKPDVVGKLDISPLLKVICAMQLSHAIPADLADDLFDVSPSTASLCLEEF